MAEPLYCPTPSRHWLVKRRVTPEDIVLDVRLAAHDARHGYVVRETTLGAADFTDTDGDVLLSQVHTVGCRDGRWSVDLVALWRGEAVALGPVPVLPEEERAFGLNPERSRRASE